MEIPTIIKWPLAQNLAYRIVNELERPVRDEDKRSNSIRVTGYLPLATEGNPTKATALCAIEIGHKWAWEIPGVVCSEPWITKGIADWHIDENGQLCFEFDSRWKQELAPMLDQYTYGLTAEYAARWLINSTRSLLSRHLFAYRNKITIWPKSWDFWAHDVHAAALQLEQLKNATIP